MSNFSAYLNGFRVHESLLMTVDGDPYKVKRTVKERLFTRPWKPWVSHRTVVPKVPDPNIMINKIERSIYGHPETIKTLMSHVESQERNSAL